MSIAMRAIVISTNFRNTDNWMRLFTHIISTGGACEAMYLSWTGDPSVRRMDQLTLPIRHQEAIPTLGHDGLDLPQLRALLNRVVDETIDVVFICDMQAYPSAAVFGILCERSRRPLVVGLQHGLFQSWWLYNQSFCADYLLCFGERHRTELLPSLRARTYPVGLPKLDVLTAIESHEHGYILYLAQRVPDGASVAQLLRELEQATGLPVVVQNHPQYVNLIEHRSEFPAPLVNGVVASEQCYLELLANANWVVTPHSTAGLEALYLHKPVVLLPNHGLTAWGGYPGVATDMSVGAVLAALERARTRTPEIAMFLEDVLGGRRFDHTQRAVQALDDLLRGKGSIDQPHSALPDVVAKCLAHGVGKQAKSPIVSDPGSEKIGEFPVASLLDTRKKRLVRRDDVVELVRQGGIGIELGVAEGFLSERFLQHKVLSHLYSIDMYAGDRGHDNDQYRRAISRLMPFREANTLIKLRFDDALHLFPDEYFDFIYVDGYAHTGEEAGATFHDWYPKLKPGGIMAGDDYCEDWPLVVVAVDRFLAIEKLSLNVIDCREDIAYSKYPTWYTVKPLTQARSK